MLWEFNIPQKNNKTVQGESTANRTMHNLRADKKENEISNAGGQRSDQTSNKDIDRKSQ